MRTGTVIHRSTAAGQTRVAADVQVYTTGLACVGLFACAAGLWAAASLVGGLIASGGPVALVTGWFKAAFGI